MDDRISRTLDDLGAQIKPGRVTVIHGPRRVGKTNLVTHFLKSETGRTLRATGDDIIVRNLLSSQNRSEILSWAQGYDTVFLDEAQRIPDIGWALKILIDSRPELRIIATGSASFKLHSDLGEPLTGRQTPLKLYPISVGELLTRMNTWELRAALDNLLIYGMYPEVRTAPQTIDQRQILNELVSSYLLKDVLELEHIKSPKSLVDLLTLIALQIGNLVSLNELAQQVGLDVKTVGRYLDLLEKAFVLVNLRGFSRNLRSEITKTSKWYFYDVGLRNALLNNYNSLATRKDTGALWENFLVMERMKALSYTNRLVPLRFWRTWEQQEIDLIEDRDGRLHAYEFKWNPQAKLRSQKVFLKNYPDAHIEVITPENFLQFLGLANSEESG